MIPRYLLGKSAAVIVDQARARYLNGPPEDTVNLRAYVAFLEGMLLIAVKDALCAADDLGVGDDTRGAEAEGRAIAFLNFALPCKET